MKLNMLRGNTWLLYPLKYLYSVMCRTLRLIECVCLIFQRTSSALPRRAPIPFEWSDIAKSRESNFTKEIAQEVKRTYVL